MNEPIRLYLANARRDDATAMDKLLTPFKDRAAIVEALEQGPGFGFAYDASQRTARYLVSDGVWASCFSLAGVSAQEADSVAQACRAKSDWSLATFQTLVARVLDGSVSKPN